MEEQKLLLRKPNNKSRCMTARTCVLLYVMISCFASHIASVAAPQYIYNFIKSSEDTNNTGIQNYSNSTTEIRHDCSDNSSKPDDHIQEEASLWNWYISIAGSGVALPVVFFIGPMIDKFGRKPLLLWNTTVLFISFALKTLVVYGGMSMEYYVIATAIEGISGTSYAFNLICHAILADVTTTGKDRSFMMTIYDALLGLGAIFSNIITGYLIQLFGFTYPYIITSCMLIVIPILVGTTLDDPWKPPQIKSKFSIIKFVTQTFSLFSKKQLGNKLCLCIMYMMIIFLRIFPYSAVSSIRTLFLLGPPFCWTSEHIGWFGAGTDFVTYILGAIILKLIHSCCIRVKDENIIVLGLLSLMASFVILGFSQNDLMVYMASVAEIFKGLSTPLIKASLSRMVRPEKQGVLFSNVYIMEVACVLMGSTVFNNIYKQTLDIYRGLIFLIMAAFPFIGFFLMIYINCKNINKDESELHIERPEIQRTDTSINEDKVS